MNKEILLFKNKKLMIIQSFRNLIDLPQLSIQDWLWKRIIKTMFYFYFILFILE